jgi:hypothetical protein
VQVREGCYGFQSLFVSDEEIGNNIVASGLDRVQQQSLWTGLVTVPGYDVWSSQGYHGRWPNGCGEEWQAMSNAVAEVCEGK